MKAINLLLVCVFITAIAMQGALAQAPKTISYQGILTDASGVAISDSTCQMTFRLYAGEQGGVTLWSETQTVAVNNGLFSAVLGQEQSFDLLFDQPYWLGISIAGEPELLPRIALSASPYSMRAVYSDSLARDSVGMEQLRAGAAVKSINTLTDHVNLVAGPNILIRQHADTIRISGETIGGNTLGQAYNQGGPGSGRTIFADAGAVNIDGPDGLLVTGRLGIGTTKPDYELDIDGTAQMNGFRMPSGAASGYVLTSDETGVGGWQAPSTFSLPYTGSVASGGPAFSITNTGTGVAGAFISKDTGSTLGLSVSASGSGHALYAFNSGTGRAAYFSITNLTSTNSTMEAINDALGSAAVFSSLNIENSSPTVEILTAGEGAALLIKQDGIGKITEFRSNGDFKAAVNRNGDFETEG
ncbi:hypothetical protein JXO59_03130, partial [candidate division KSB1 bacterium]|nr:hypothetical protein [candidate division KSB1 bacterium]